MASCLNIYLTDKIDYAADTYKKLKEANAAGSANEQMNNRMDGVGMTWMLDDKNDIVWNNGATSDFNGYVGFTKDKKKGVVILSDLSPNRKIPMTVIDAKILTDAVSAEI